MYFEERVPYGSKHFRQLIPGVLQNSEYRFDCRYLEYPGILSISDRMRPGYPEVLRTFRSRHPCVHLDTGYSSNSLNAQGTYPQVRTLPELRMICLLFAAVPGWRERWANHLRPRIIRKKGMTWK